MGRTDWGEYVEDLAGALARGDEGRAAEIVSALAGSGRLDAADAEGRTALHAAAVAGRLDLCEMLLQAGADVRARDKFGATAFSVFGRSGESSHCEAGRVASLFATYGDGPRQVLCTILRRTGPETRGRQGGRGRVTLAAFFARLEAALGFAGLPGLTRVPERGGLRMLWLSEGEVKAARRVVTATAREAGFGGEIDFVGVGVGEPLGFDAAPAGGA